MAGFRRVCGLVSRPLKPYSFKLTASAYNFNWWFNGSYLIFPLGNSTICILCELTRIKGIGQYTSRLTLLFSRRFYTKLPIDRWVSRIVSEAYKIPVGDVESFYTSRLGLWAGLGVCFLTIVLDAVPLRRVIERVKVWGEYPEMSGLTPLTLWMFR